MPALDIDYDKLPQLVKDNVSENQWPAAQREAIADGDPVPEDSYYINLKNGQVHHYARGEAAHGPLLPCADLSGARGKDSRQFYTDKTGTHPNR